MHRVDAVGNSSGVRRELAEGIGNLSGWRKGVRQKKTETHRKIVGGSRKAYREVRLDWIGRLEESLLSVVHVELRGIGGGLGSSSSGLSILVLGGPEGNPQNWSTQGHF
ncbi:hypothetical protein GW17_00037127 [Ensete ventricosum]|nr:hypothetical protein GW17_00037127 [Ensete ventricosum]